MFSDPLELITYVSLGIGSVVGFLTIRNEVRKSRLEQRQEISHQITAQADKVIEHIDVKLKVVDEKFKVTEKAVAENKEDIEDVEDDVKLMMTDWRKICETLSKHDYIIDEVVPEFKSLKSEFYRFKGAVDNIVTKKPDSLINIDKNERKT